MRAGIIAFYVVCVVWAIMLRKTINALTVSGVTLPTIMFYARGVVKTTTINAILFVFSVIEKISVVARLLRAGLLGGIRGEKSEKED